MLEELYSCTNILHTKRETFLAYNFPNQNFFVFTETHYEILKEM